MTLEQHHAEKMLEIRLLKRDLEHQLRALREQLRKIKIDVAAMERMIEVTEVLIK